jgi:hypothetical protein
MQNQANLDATSSQNYENDENVRPDEHVINNLVNFSWMIIN